MGICIKKVSKGEKVSKVSKAFFGSPFDTSDTSGAFDTFKRAGFTLIELLFVFSIFSILSTMGIASFVSYSRAQSLSAATFDVSTMLQVAKSRASSQVIPTECGTDQLTGYSVLICGLPSSTCSTAQTFELHALCGTTPPLIQRKTLPNGIQFDQDPLRTTSTNFTFHILTGVVDGPGIVSIKGYSNSINAIQVDQVGNIGAVNAPAASAPTPTTTPYPTFPQSTPTPIPTSPLLPTATAVPTQTPTSAPTPTSAVLAGLTRGAVGDLWADIVLGQPDFSETVPGEITNFKGSGPGGVVVDRSARPNRVYIWDGMNSRILGYSSLGTCSNSTNACSSDSDCLGSTCTIQVGGVSGTKKADLVIGQIGFNTSACNGDGTWQSFPNRASASSQSLCSLEQDVGSVFEDGSFTSLAVDASGNLYVPDFHNNRVLKYNSPFTTDTIADDVWGQNDFISNGCDKNGPADNSTLCFRYYINNASAGMDTFEAGVAIDSNGNLWVADIANNRVLRFSKNISTGQISKTADLVLGQSNFQGENSGSGLSQMSHPDAVVVDVNNRVYVADPGNSRILMFNNPTSSGVQGQLFAPSVSLSRPTGVTLDVAIASDSLSGGLWVNDTGNNRIILFDFSGNPKKVLNKDTISRDTGCGPNGSICTSPLGGGACNLCDSRSSIGITSDGDVIAAASSNFQQVNFYKHPIPTPFPDHTYGPAYQFFAPPDGHNYLSNKGFTSDRGVAVSSTQTIVSDALRILFWNTPNGISDLSNGKAADGVAGVANFTTLSSSSFGRIATDGTRFLWAARGSNLEKYTLPLTMGQTPAQTIPFSQLVFLDGRHVASNVSSATDIYADPNGAYLWLALMGSQRVVRVRIPSASSGTFVIDAVLGGDNTVPGDSFSFDRLCSDPTILCTPGALNEDKNHNLYVSDYQIENAGPGILYRYDAVSFPTNNTSLIVLNAAQASHFYSGVYGWRPVFNSQNKMVIGGALFTSRAGRLWIQGNLALQTGTTLAGGQYFGDYYLQAFSSVFDAADNLFVTDMNRGRLLIYKNPAL